MSEPGSSLGPYRLHCVDCGVYWSGRSSLDCWSCGGTGAELIIRTTHWDVGGGSATYLHDGGAQIDSNGVTVSPVQPPLEAVSSV